MTKQKLSETIASAYQGCDEFVLVALRDFILDSRKYGFPLVCSVHGRPEKQLLLFAARLLLKVTNTWPHIDDIESSDFELIQNSMLHTDAAHLVSHVLLNSRHMGLMKQ